MNKLAFNILRIGLAITFIWIGIMILQSPESWGSLIQPWALKFLAGTSVKQAMISTAILDIVVGIFLLLNLWVWLAALVGAFHIVVVLITVGINEITVRDIGLLGATIALMLYALPSWISRKFS